MKKIFALLFAILMLCSCGAENPAEQPGIDIPEELYADSVPDVEIKIENLGYSVKASVGGYNWDIDNGDGTRTNTIACGMHPLDFQNIAYFETFGKEKITLVFEQKPLSYDLVRYETDRNRFDDGAGYEGTEKSETVKTKEDSFVISGDGKDFVYVINAKYPEGNVEYAFEILQCPETVELYKIVDGAENGKLVLAGNEVMTLNADKVPVFLDGEPADASVLMDGMTAEIHHSGEILETYPSSFGKVFEIHVYSVGTKNEPGGTYFDLCGLYLKVLDDLWSTDSGLNRGAEMVSIDLTEAPGGLSAAEKAAIAWIFGNEHDVMALDFTHEELKKEGYLTAAGGSDNLYQWDNGVLLSITDDFGEDQDEHYSLPVIKFNAMKWRSPLGAYMFTGCSAVWPQMGTWEDYNVGAHAIA